MLIDSISSLTANMQKRGEEFLISDLKTNLIETTILHLTFDTVDSMGANFISPCLEKIANTLQSLARDHEVFLKERFQLRSS